MARKSFVQIKTDNGWKLIPKSEHRAENRSAMIMPDIDPVRSPIDGTMLTSRSRHREHLKRHGVVCVGNEKLSKCRPDEPKVDHALKRQLHYLWENVSQEGPR